MWEQKVSSQTTEEWTLFCYCWKGSLVKISLQQDGDAVLVVKLHKVGLEALMSSLKSKGVPKHTSLLSKLLLKPLHFYLSYTDSWLSASCLFLIPYSDSAVFFDSKFKFTIKQSEAGAAIVIPYCQFVCNSDPISQTFWIVLLLYPDDIFPVISSFL
jgi:hypothetical protein